MMDKGRLSVEDNYNKWWKELIENEDGSVNLGQLKKELSDFSALIDNVPLILEHVTGGKVSKHLTDVSVVCSLADEHYDDVYNDEETVMDTFRAMCEESLDHGTYEKSIDVEKVLRSTRHRLREF